MLVGVLVVAGCGEAQPPPEASTTSTTISTSNVYEDQRAAGVQAALDELSTALSSGDRARVRGVLDAAALPRFRDRMIAGAVDLGRRGPIVDPVPTESTSSVPSTTSDPASPSPGTADPESSPSAEAPDSAEPPTPEPAHTERGSRLRLKTLRYRVAPTTEAETPVPGELQTRLDAQGSSDSWVAPVELHYALGGAAVPGIDEPEVVVDTELVVARYGDTWKIVGDGSAIGAAAAPAQLWDLPGLAALDVSTAGGRSVIASYPGTAPTVDRVRDLLPGAVTAVTAFWGRGWAQRAVVVATAQPTEFRPLAQTAGTDITAAAAATVFTRIDKNARTALGQRVVLTPQASMLSEAALGVVLRHELTHVAARVDTRPGAPLWITEGVPEYVGRTGTYHHFDDAAPNLADTIRAGRPPADLPADRDFAIDGDGALVAYQSAWSVAAFVASRFGVAALKKLYLGVAATDDRARQDAAIRAALGKNRTQFVAAWRTWLTEQARR